MTGALGGWTTPDVRRPAWPDVLSVLPHRPRTMAVLDGGGRWRALLLDAGLREAAAGEVPDLAVTGAGAARAALGTGARTVLVEGRVPGRAVRGGEHARRLLAVPHWEAPEVLLPLDRPELAAYAAAHLLPAATWARRLRTRVLGTRPVLAALRGWPGAVAILSREPIRPFALSAPAARAVPRDAEWLLRPGTGDPSLKRNVVYLFEPGASTPGWVLKVARLAGYAAPFERDADAAEVVATAPAIVRAHAPVWLGTFEVDGVRASLETAGAGVRLLDLLRSHRARQAKLRAVERVGDWLVEVAAATAGSPAELDAERRDLTERALARWAPFGAPEDLADRFPAIRPVLRHGDLWTGNVLVERDTFTVVDWETAYHGLPLWDGLTLLADALAVADGCAGDDAREDHFARLFRGELPGSAVLFAWVRRARAATAIPPEAVGPVATLLWLDRGFRPWSGRHDAPVADRPLKARLAHRWLQDPALGPGWSAWR